MVHRLLLLLLLVATPALALAPDQLAGLEARMDAGDTAWVHERGAVLAEQVQADRDDAAALLLGQAALAENDPQTALFWFRAAQAWGAGRLAHLGLIQALVALDRTTEAEILAASDDTEALRPALAEALVARARQLAAEGQIDAATALAARAEALGHPEPWQALDQPPPDDETVARRAEALQEAGDDTAAADVACSASLRNPRNKVLRSLCEDMSTQAPVRFGPGLAGNKTETAAGGGGEFDPARSLALLGLDPAVTVAVLIAGTTFLIVLAVGSAVMPDTRTQRRLAALARREQQMRQAAASAPAGRRQRLAGAAAGVGLIRRVVSRLNLVRSRQAAQIRSRLTQAGMRSPDALAIYLFMKLVLPFLGGGLAIGLLYGLEVITLDPMLRLAAALGGVVLGAYAPDLYIRNTITHRQQTLTHSLPDVLDMMVICTEAGLSMDASLARVSHAMMDVHPELAEELRLTSMELRFLPDRREALNNFAHRTEVPAITSVVSTLLQTERYGTPLSHSLRVLAQEYRKNRMTLAEEKAARLPTLLTLPMILFILPALFLVLMGPAIIQAVDKWAL